MLLRRSRRVGALWWTAAASVAAVGTLRLGAAERAVADERAAWGTPVVVAVATADLAPGAAVGPADVELAERPAAMVPVGALTSVPIGEVVTAPVVAGEVLVDARVGTGGLSPVAARVPAGQRAVAVPTAAAVPPLRVGDLVDVLDGGGVVVAAALVVDVADGAVTLAVAAADAPALAAAASGGSVALALVGPG